ncbi:MAG: hypothetical protein ACLP29_16440, partial [Dissulfurispiraceae bacterium]
MFSAPMLRKAMQYCLMSFLLFLLALPAFTEGIQTLDVVEVTESADNPIGITDSATEGTAPTEEVQSRPYYRP